jgi:hypothetical protein
MLQKFGVAPSKLCYFVLDNTYANDTAVNNLAITYSFATNHRRLRFAPNTINLMDQAILIAHNKDAYDNNPENCR